MVPTTVGVHQADRFKHIVVSINNMTGNAKQPLVVMKFPISNHRSIDLAVNVSVPKVLSTQELEIKTKPFLASL